MSTINSSTDSESTIKDDQKDHNHVSSSKPKRYRSRNPQSSQKLKELIARKNAARKRNKNFNKHFSSKVYYIQDQSKSLSYDQIESLFNQKKGQKTEKENKTETQSHSYSNSNSHETTENTNDTLLSFTPSELNLSEVFQSVLESSIYSNSNLNSTKTNVNSNSYDTTASIEETEEKEAHVDENLPDESSCCQCWWIISILGTIILLAIFGPSVYNAMTKIEIEEINKNVEENWKRSIDQSFTAYENKTTFENMKEFTKFHDICFDPKFVSGKLNSKKNYENNDQNEYLETKKKELKKSQKAIPNYVFLTINRLRVEIKLEDRRNELDTHSLDSGMYKLQDFDEQNKKPIYVKEYSSRSISLRYYKNLWSVVKKTKDPEKEYEVLIVWKFSEDVDHPGKLDSTKHSAEVILCNVERIHGVAKDDTTKEINTDVNVFYE